MNKKAIKLIAVLAFLALMTCLAPWVGEMLYFNYYDVLDKQIFLRLVMQGFSFIVLPIMSIMFADFLLLKSTRKILMI